MLLWAQGVATFAGMRVKITEPDVSPMQIQGPKSPLLMAVLFGDRAGELRYYRCRENRLVHGGGTIIGRMTRAAFSPRLRKNIGFANLPLEKADLGMTFMVETPAGQVAAAELFGHDGGMVPWGCPTVEA